MNSYTINSFLFSVIVAILIFLVIYNVIPKDLKQKIFKTQNLLLAICILQFIGIGFLAWTYNNLYVSVNEMAYQTSNNDIAGISKQIQRIQDDVDSLNKSVKFSQSSIDVIEAYQKETSSKVNSIEYQIRYR